jgi:hypothetical protein
MNIKESIFTHKIQNLESLESYFLTAVKKVSVCAREYIPKLKIRNYSSVNFFCTHHTFSRFLFSLPIDSVSGSCSSVFMFKKSKLPNEVDLVGCCCKTLKKN